MAKKSTTISMIIFGLVFIALGIVLFSIQQEILVVLIIAGLDVLFGISLIAGGVLTNTASQNQAPVDDRYVQPYPVQNERREREDYFDEQPVRQPVRETEEETDNLDAEEAAEMDPAELAAREGELRVAAKRAAEEATRAKKIATQAVQEAKDAENELRMAEEELANLSPADQRAAMREIDMLAQTAAEKSEIAVQKAKQAKLAIRNAREAAELHSMAMDAAASALSGDDEFADFD